MDRNNECLMTGNAGFRETTQRFVNSVGVATWEWRKEKKKIWGTRFSGVPFHTPSIVERDRKLGPTVEKKALYRADLRLETKHISINVT